MRTMKTTPIVIIRRALWEDLAEGASTDEADSPPPLAYGGIRSGCLNGRAGKTRV